ncbi:unnamed protein product [Spirodela intermedia]|uniref:Enhancer of polycomb-like protein n=1 Tax=Spirodela intermedia TaxID=51605 RepID=A0A7I8JKX2_SPIIN|nr:unnamed protein product [Spirodela intermedia]CAA6670799.1 unnamed protein product [Spirodela intermedia]
MSRLSFRPRPLDIHKKLPIVKSIKDFEDDDVVTTTATRNQLQRFVAEADNEVPPTPSKKLASDIPTPQFVIVDTYERDYTRTFNQTTSYLRGEELLVAARAELGEFVEYDLDNEDEDWLQEFNNERKILSDEKFESLLFKLEVLDHKARERAGVITPTLGSPVPVLLQLDAAAETLEPQSIRYAVFQSVYNYWKKKREQWQKPILRQLQAPPPVNDTNPYNVFRPREKIHRLHTRRMQRRENNAQVRRNLEQAKTLLETLIKREEKKRDAVENELTLQRFRMKYKHEAQLVDDGMAFSGFQPRCKLGSSEDEFMDSDDMMTKRPRGRPSKAQNFPSQPPRLLIPAGRMRRELKRRPLARGWLQKSDSHQPVLVFTKPLDPEKLAAAGVVPPSGPPVENGSIAPPYQFFGRIGRGGRIIFDRKRNQ